MFQFTHPGKGATYASTRDEVMALRFNSRTLGRVRRGAGSRGYCLQWCFNSRTLGRVRLRSKRALLENSEFQFTHPGKGATKDGRGAVEDLERFNSRTLGRVRRRHIHRLRILRMFQFTHPGKGATLRLHKLSTPPLVSIHAPWEGCDSVVQRCVL